MSHVNLTNLPSLRHSLGSIVVPGDRISRLIVDSIGGGDKISLLSGSGTYTRGGYVFASVHGTLQGHKQVSSEEVVDGGSGDSKELSSSPLNSSSPVTLSVTPFNGYFAHDEVICVGQVVLGRVVRTHSSHQQAVIRILAIQDVSGLLRHHPEGVIRREDVRTSATDRLLQIQNYFRMDDLVLARVLSLGDSRRYFLSTAEPSLGVIYAISSASGRPMIPINSSEMQCPETEAKELRKCARPPIR